VISAKQTLINEDNLVEFWPAIDEATGLPPWEEFLSPARAEMHL
jgi:hypothetical protein